MRRTFWPCLVAATVLLAGCSGKPTPKEPDTTSTPSPTATPPPLPEAATHETAEGAASFVDHYLDVLNYSAHTGDTDALRALSASGCGSCSNYLDVVDATHDAGGGYTGGDWTTGDLTVTAEGSEWRLDGEVTTAAGTFDDGSNELTPTASSTLVVVFFAEYVDGVWRMNDFLEPGK